MSAAFRRDHTRFTGWVALGLAAAVSAVSLPATPAVGHPGEGTNPLLQVRGEFVRIDLRSGDGGPALLDLRPEPSRDNPVTDITYRLEILYRHGDQTMTVLGDLPAGSHGLKAIQKNISHDAYWDGNLLPFGSFDYDRIREVVRPDRHTYVITTGGRTRNVWLHDECSPRSPLSAHVQLYEVGHEGSWTAFGVVTMVAFSALGIVVSAVSVGTLAPVGVAVIGVGFGLYITLMSSGSGDKLLVLGTVPLDTNGTVRHSLERNLALPPYWDNMAGADVVFLARASEAGTHAECGDHPTHVPPDPDAEKIQNDVGALFDELRHAYQDSGLVPLAGYETAFTGPGFEVREEARAAFVKSLARLVTGVMADGVADFAGGDEALNSFAQGQALEASGRALDAFDAYEQAFGAAANALIDGQPSRTATRRRQLLLAPDFIVVDRSDTAAVLGTVTGTTQDDELVAVTVTGRPSGLALNPAPGVVTQGIILSTKLGDDLQEGVLVGLERVQGAQMEPPSGECPAPHLVAAEGDGVRIGDDGPFPQPEHACGYGTVYTSNMPIPGGAVPPDATYGEGLFHLTAELEGVHRGSYEVNVIGHLADGGQVQAPLRLFVDGEPGARPRGIDHACPRTDVRPAGFRDVPASSPHALAIDCAAHWDITTGTAPGFYSPGEPTRRDQMASFLVRLIEAYGGVLPASPPDAFADDDGSVHEPAINRLAAAGIVRGTGPGTYDPRRVVTRGQMASFLARTYAYLAGQPLPTDIDYFSDTAHSVHRDAINGVAGAGIAAGTGAGLYGTEGPTRRDQMASFLTRLLDTLIAGIDPDLTDPEPEPDPEPDPDPDPEPDPEPEPEPEHTLTVRVQSDTGELSSDHIDVDPDKDAYEAGEVVTLTAPEDFESGGYQHHFAAWMVEPAVPHEYEDTTLWVTMETDVTATAFYESGPVESSATAAGWRRGFLVV